MGLSLIDVQKKVGRETHLQNISLDFESNSLNILLGRTLAGKTSLLRIMAGLDRPTRGRVIIDGQDVTGLSVRKRKVAMVYQQFINFPSMSVYKNIASPLKMAGFKRREIDRRVRETAEMLHIDPFLDRLPSELSGGQQQRVAIARSLVKDTQLLLLDEPLVNLDYKLREELRVELGEIFKKRRAVVVYTTTEPTEALMLGGNIVIVDQGRIIQTGPTPLVYHNPETMKVAEVFSDPPINFMDSSVSENHVCFGRDIRMPLTGHLIRLEPGDYKLGVRPNHLNLCRTDDSDIEFKARVELSEINGSETITHVNHNNTSLVVLAEGIFPHKIGSEIPVFINSRSLFMYSNEGSLIASPAIF